MPMSSRLPVQSAPSWARSSNAISSGVSLSCGEALELFVVDRLLCHGLLAHAMGGRGSPSPSMPVSERFVDPSPPAHPPWP